MNNNINKNRIKNDIQNNHTYLSNNNYYNNHNLSIIPKISNINKNTI